MSARPDWIDEAAWDLALAYSDRIFSGEVDAIDEAIAVATDILDIRTLPEAATQ